MSTIKRLVLLIFLGLSSTFLYSQKCDTIFKPNRFYKGAEFPNGINGIYQYMGKEMYCRPIGDTIDFKVITFLIDKNGKAYVKKITGYNADCEYYIRRKVENMPKWNPSIVENKKVCYEEDIPIIINKK